MSRRLSVFPIAVNAVFVLLAACSAKDNGTGVPTGADGSITLAVQPTSATVQQGGNTSVVGTITRGGGFPGAITLTVEGAPDGVTGSAGTVTSSGDQSFATISVQVGSTVAPGTYTLTARGHATGLTDAVATFTLTVAAIPPTPSYTMTVTPAALSIVQGRPDSSGQVTLTRTNFAGAVTLTLESGPAGVSGAFNLTQTTASSSAMIVTVGAAVAPGVYNLTVRAVAAGMTDRTAGLTLTVTAAPSFALSIAPTSVSLIQGATTATPTITINRVNFPASVTLSVENAPPGLTATVSPAATTGNSATLTLTASATLTPGIDTLTIRGVSAGLRAGSLRAGSASLHAAPDQTVTFVVTIVANTSVVYDYSNCAAASKPLWLAFQNGTGAWSRVAGVNDVYRFTIDQSRGGVAIVPSAGTLNFTLQAQSYFTTKPFVFCAPAGLHTAAQTNKTVNATVVGLAAGETANITFGGSGKVITANGPIQFSVPTGPQDLVAYKVHTSDIFGPHPGSQDRMVLVRNQDIIDGGTLGAIDLSASALQPVATQLNIPGTDGDNQIDALAYITRDCLPDALWGIRSGATAPLTWFGVPVTSQVASDLYRVSIQDVGSNPPSGVAQISRFLTQDAHSLTGTVFNLGAVPAAVAVTVLPGPYFRPQMTFTMPSEYDQPFTLSYNTRCCNFQYITFTVSPAWAGGSTFTLTTPDFSAMPGWNNAWVPADFSQGGWVMGWAGSASTTAACAEGRRAVSINLTGVFP